jgi:hypothetical protein
MILLAGAVALSATSAMAAKDNFNRQSLGKNWADASGSLYVTNDQLRGNAGSLGYFTPSSGDWKATATVYLNGTGVEYGAVALGDIAGGNNAYIKIQSQDGDGQFEYGAFYVGNNGEGEFFRLKKPASSPATISAWFCGTYGFLKIQSAAGLQKYYYNYGTSFGPGAGLGTGRSISLDNYKSGQASCSRANGATMIRDSGAHDLSK